jgi:hypothetical protein
MWKMVGRWAAPQKIRELPEKKFYSDDISKGTENICSHKTCTQMCTVALFVITK